MKRSKLASGGLVGVLLFCGGVAYARYLEPEPMMQSPSYVKQQAKKGKSVAVYSYANNNPVNESDPSGLMTLDINSAKNCGPDVMKKWVEAHDIAEKMASSCKCATAFRNEYHTSLSDLLSYASQNPIVRFGDTASSGYAGQQQGNYITLNCSVFSGSASSIALAGTLVHELGHWSDYGFGNDLGAEGPADEAEEACEQAYYSGSTAPCPNSCNK